MKNFGFSEARIFIGKDSVLKMTPMARTQALHLQTLGPKISPRVIESHPNYYIMEKLEQPTPDKLFTVETVNEVKRTLQNDVHTRLPHVLDFDWQSQLGIFLEGYSYLLSPSTIEKFYDYPGQDQYSLIHGDPILGNVMTRNGKILLIDPVAPRGKVPSLPEVDYGKLLQSVLGWEAIQQKTPYKSEHLISTVLQDLPNPKLIWFWATVHIIRLLPRAHGRPDIVKWVDEKVTYCRKQIND